MFLLLFCFRSTAVAGRGALTCASQLDPLRLAHAILGDEQVFDVELDRNTELLPLRGDTRKVGWHDDDHEHSTSTLRALGCDKSMGREDGTGDTAADSGMCLF